MIKRLVKMHFKEEAVKDFQQLFEERKGAISSFEGCLHLELWQDHHQPNIFFTYSIWESEDYLNHYRFSDFFKETWKRTKSMFQSPAEAWSLVVQ